MCFSFLSVYRCRAWPGMDLVRTQSPTVSLKEGGWMKKIGLFLADDHTLVRGARRPYQTNIWLWEWSQSGRALIKVGFH